MNYEDIERCPCCGYVFGCYCHEYPHKKPSCPGRIAEWMNSEEGKKAITEAQKRADETIKRLREASKVDPKSLHQPMTI